MTHDRQLLELALAIGPARSSRPGDWHQDLEAWFERSWRSRSTVPAWAPYCSPNALWTALREQLDRARAIGARPVLIHDPLYPKSLLRLARPPALLFCRGQLDLLTPRQQAVPKTARAIGIVGSRAATPDAVHAARLCAGELGKHQITTISGGAIGVDTAAHQGALACGGPTISVLGSGICNPYPPRNQALFEQIARRGLLISPFLPLEPPRRWHFPFRNQLIAALSERLVVVSASSRSGAMITASIARELGLPLAAYRFGSGALALIARGARPLEGRASVRNWLASNTPWIDVAPDERRPIADLEQRAVYQAIVDKGPLSAPQIARQAELPLPRALSALVLLELEGWVFAEADHFVAL